MKPCGTCRFSTVCIVHGFNQKRYTGAGRLATLFDYWRSTGQSNGALPADSITVAVIRWMKCYTNPVRS